MRCTGAARTGAGSLIDMLGIAEVRTTVAPVRRAVVACSLYQDGSAVGDVPVEGLGRSLADPSSNATPAMHGSNFRAYLVLDKMLWRKPDTANQGLASFSRRLRSSDRKPDAFNPCVPIPGSNRSAISQAGITLASGAPCQSSAWGCTSSIDRLDQGVNSMSHFFAGGASSRFHHPPPNAWNNAAVSA